MILPMLRRPPLLFSDVISIISPKWLASWLSVTREHKQQGLAHMVKLVA